MMFDTIADIWPELSVVTADHLGDVVEIRFSDGSVATLPERQYDAFVNWVGFASYEVFRRSGGCP
jgi:hypothetical protein